MKVKVYDENPIESMQGFYGDYCAMVKYNSRLDYWDGSNWANGGLGMHKGITRLRRETDTPYVIIIGSQWQGAVDYGYCVTAEDAAQEIIRAGRVDEHWVWPEIRAIIEEMDDEE